ncbi:MAG: PEP-CTERM sorting domain-containing protein [Candidatus Aureabacteria bacterium]|nr:PEP-CTERM sorting domain-containing protein [Candidatus Auribacterota bacterium]
MKGVFMKKLLPSFLSACFIAFVSSNAFCWVEDFSSDPGWNYAGESSVSLFSWNGASGAVGAQWSSDKLTTRYYTSLGDDVTENSSFKFGCDIQLNSLAQDPWGMEIAFGLFNSNNTGDNRTGYYDGDFNYHTGDTINTLEMDYFPYQDGYGGPWFGGTVIPSVDSDPDEPGNQVKVVYSGSEVTYSTVGFDGGELPLNIWLYPEVTYNASDKTVSFIVYTDAARTSIAVINGVSAVSNFIYTGDAFVLNSFGFFSYYDYLDFDPATPSINGTGMFDNAYFTVVPEPSSFVLFIGGLLGVFFFRPRKKA